MAKIQELPENLTNQIAAGEVIERPSSVVKELVENAVDAKSTLIDIEIEEAGLRKIKVSDNGQGIHPDEVALAFERHATSKIYTQEDLFRIHSLGFRGEALPSIASIAKVTLESAIQDQPGKIIEITGGKVLKEQIHGTKKGTIITVENLFFNTPARLKYIRSLQTELSNITDIVNRISLSHPNIAFRLTHDGNQLMKTSGNGKLQQAIAGVYGTKVARKMLTIEAEDLDFKVWGEVSLPEVTRASRNYLTVIMNGRYIRNYSLLQAIVEGYGSRLMVGRYPIGGVNIQADPLLLDVNVHPSKKEMRISKEKELLTLIVKAIQAALSNVSAIPSGLDSLSFKRKRENIEEVPKVEPIQTDFMMDFSFEKTEETFEVTTPQAISESKLQVEPFVIEEHTKQIETEELAQPPEHNEPLMKTVSRLEKERVPEKTFPELHYFGQMHGTYLFAQSHKGLYMIDQHAAQERIKYEYYRDEIANVSSDSQGLLVPITFDLTLDDYIKVTENIDKLEEIGVYLEPFGSQTLMLNQHPTWFKKNQEEAIVQDIIDMILEDKALSLKKLREATAIMMSCKRSIKANHYLPEHEARNLLIDLAKTKNPYNCPHGRPVMVHLSNQDMEKLFKRIQDPH